jgi:hypothetical protein
MRPIILTLLALLATPVLAAEPPLSAPTESLTAPTRPTANGMTQYCMYASQPYSVGSVLNGRVCGYESDGWQQPPDRSNGAIWRLPIDGEHVPPVGAR